MNPLEDGTRDPRAADQEAPLDGYMPLRDSTATGGGRLGRSGSSGRLGGRSGSSLNQLGGDPSGGGIPPRTYSSGRLVRNNSSTLSSGSRRSPLPGLMGNPTSQRKFAQSSETLHDFYEPTVEEEEPDCFACMGPFLKAFFTLGTAPSLWCRVDTNATDAKYQKMVDMFSLQNVALAGHYFNIGVAMNFLTIPITYYIVDTADGEASTLNVFAALAYIPWFLKIFIGLGQDCYPIRGQHRKPYIVMGWLMFVASYLWLAAYANPPIHAIFYATLLATLGYSIADVAADGLIVERSKFESANGFGIMRTEAYIIRSMGGVLGSILGTCLYNKPEWGWGLNLGQNCLLQALLPVLTVFPLLPYLVDAEGGYREFWTQVSMLWDLCQRKSVYEPMVFVYFYLMLATGNPAWANYLLVTLGYAAWQIGVIGILSSVVSWFGIYMYREVFFDTNWRSLYVVTTVLSLVFSLAQLLLIFHDTGAIPSLLFVAVDNAAINFLTYLRFMPSLIVAVAVTPEGLECCCYAALTTLMNAAQEIAKDVASALPYLWNVSNCALSKDKVQGLAKLTVLVTLVGATPCFFVNYFPRNRAEVFARLKTEDRNKFAGICFVALLFVAIFGSLVYCVIILSEVTSSSTYCDDDDGPTPSPTLTSSPT
eukprot:CAMPEP_0172603424 /NCGR_PEP_ID=MMETSP1068-20121228/23676_1 /TAXON_ID=35684 /ORGANISM="Pseudopedinella elastica, Strain CCMP716" /LENGTH=650 /DNA_ID=CAMNT_0013405161 /DNA_START=143 /DNA_END=2095 /DNA_ORIENTATION=+